MKGILLTAGLGTRLYPITRLVCKSALPVYDRPMFYWSLQTLIDSGVNDVAIVIGPPFGTQIKKIVKYFHRLSEVRIRFVVQHYPKGMPDAMDKCRNIFKGENIMVIAGDNYYDKDFKKEVLSFKKGAVSFLRRVKDPQRYGVPIFKNKKIIGIVEKPKNPTSNWAIIGPHIFDKNVFDYISTLKPSARGELEIQDLNNIYIKRKSLKLIKRRDKWGDAGTFDSLLYVGQIAKNSINKK